MSRISKKTRRGGGNRTRRRTRRTRRRTMKGGAPPRDNRTEIPIDLFAHPETLRRIPTKELYGDYIVPDQTQHLTLQFLNTRISNELNDLRQHIRKLEDDIKELKLNNLLTDAVSPHAIVPREEYPIGHDIFEPLMDHQRALARRTR